MKTPTLSLLLDAQVDSWFFYDEQHPQWLASGMPVQKASYLLTDNFLVFGIPFENSSIFLRCYACRLDDAVLFNLLELTFAGVVARAIRYFVCRHQLAVSLVCAFLVGYPVFVFESNLALSRPVHVVERLGSHVLYDGYMSYSNAIAFKARCDAGNAPFFSINTNIFQLK